MKLGQAIEQHQNAVRLSFEQLTKEQTEKLLPFIDQLSIYSATKLLEETTIHGLADQLNTPEMIFSLQSLCRRISGIQQWKRVLSSLNEAGITADEVISPLFQDKEIATNLFAKASDDELELFLSRGYVHLALENETFSADADVAARLMRVAYEKVRQPKAYETAACVAGFVLDEAADSQDIESMRRIATALKIWVTRDVRKGSDGISKFIYDEFFGPDAGPSRIALAMQAPDAMFDLMLSYRMMQKRADAIGLPDIEQDPQWSAILQAGDLDLDDDWEELLGRLKTAGFDRELFTQLIAPMSLMIASDDNLATNAHRDLADIIAAAANFACMFDNKEQIQHYLDQYEPKNMVKVFGLHAQAMRSVPAHSMSGWKHLLIDHGMNGLRMMANHGKLLADDVAYSGDDPWLFSSLVARIISSDTDYSEAPLLAYEFIEKGYSKELFDFYAEVAEARPQMADNLPRLVIDGHDIGQPDHMMIPLREDDPHLPSFLQKCYGENGVWTYRHVTDSARNICFAIAKNDSCISDVDDINAIVVATMSDDQTLAVVDYHVNPDNPQAHGIMHKFIEASAHKLLTHKRESKMKSIARAIVRAQRPGGPIAPNTFGPDSKIYFCKAPWDAQTPPQSWDRLSNRTEEDQFQVARKFDKSSGLSVASHMLYRVAPQ